MYLLNTQLLMYFLKKSLSHVLSRKLFIGIDLGTERAAMIIWWLYKLYELWINKQKLITTLYTTYTKSNV